MHFDGVTYPDVKLHCNRENMTKLVNALESGDYAQGRGYLQTAEDGNRQFCCLGVACDISGLGHWGPVDGSYAVSYVTGRYEDGGFDRVFLPDKVAEWLGVEGIDIELGMADPGDALVATMLNDAEEPPYDFAAIAAQIRRVYLED